MPIERLRYFMDYGESPLLQYMKNRNNTSQGLSTIETINQETLGISLQGGIIQVNGMCDLKYKMTREDWKIFKKRIDKEIKKYESQS